MADLWLCGSVHTAPSTVAILSVFVNVNALLQQLFLRVRLLVVSENGFSVPTKALPTPSVSGSGHCWSMVTLGNGSGTNFQASPLTSIGRWRWCSVWVRHKAASKHYCAKNVNTCIHVLQNTKTITEFWFAPLSLLTPERLEVVYIYVS